MSMVLILVLMDNQNTLRRVAYYAKRQVLILVLMDNKIQRENRIAASEAVLILVLMDNQNTSFIYE